jgi:hypothetical protein
MKSTPTPVLPFLQEHYVVVPTIVAEPLLGFLWRHLLQGAPALETHDNFVPDSPALYGDPVMEYLLRRLQPQVEELTGMTLYPTYSYARLYKGGDALRRHRDRPACEISVTINLGETSHAGWPLWLGGRDAPVSVALGPGDGLLYRGIDIEHWREPFTGERLGQVFLHYVEQDGPFAEWRYDKRESLNLCIPLPL